MKKGFWLLIIICLIGASVYVKFSDKFESNAPKILLNNASGGEIFFNGKSALALQISDESAIKEVIIEYQKEGDAEFIELERLAPNNNHLTHEIKLPAPKFNEKITFYKLQITARDSSLWGWFMGNKITKNFRIELDRLSPRVSVLANSYSITKGGAAVVVFLAQDEHLKDLYIQSGSHKFAATPFGKDDFYISLLAWDVQDDNYSADIIATDLAGNTTRAHVPLFQTVRKYKTSTIKVGENFVNGNKIKELYENYASEPASSPAQMFDYVNATLRIQNEALIHQITSTPPDALAAEFNIKPFSPLKNPAKVADFADHRFYEFAGEKISESWHMGIDLANVKMAPITLSNPGRLAFAQENGIYGLNLLVDHGLGLYSLYGHCSKVNVLVGDELAAGTIIANTGTSGLALGDHLHFGVLVQGVEVRPEEWFDGKWIKNNITDVIKKAKESIKK